MGLICTYIFQSFVYSCNVRYSTKKKNKSCLGFHNISSFPFPSSLHLPSNPF